MNNELLAKAQQNLTTATDQPQVSGDQHAANIINGLFKSLFAAKTGWRASFNTKDPDELAKGIDLLKKTWIKAFAENGINTPEQLSCGMKQVRKDPSQFLPSVGQFIEWCKPSPEDYGLPGEYAAWLEATTNSKVAQRRTHNWSHAAVYEAASIVGWMELARATNQGPEKKEFFKAYQSVCEQVMNGGAVSVPEVVENALEHHDSGEKVLTEESKAASKAALAEIRKGWKV